MLIDAAIIDINENFKDDLARLLQTYCPFLGLNLSINSIQDLLQLHKSKPKIIFLNPNDYNQEECIAFYRYQLDIESVLILNKNRSMRLVSYFRPVGYLFRPFHEELLISTLEVVKKIIQYKLKGSVLDLSSRVAIPTIDGFDFIEVNDIIRCESISGCTRIIIGKGRKDLISSYNIGEFRKLLNRHGFFSPHKSHLINLTKVSNYKREGIIRMEGDDNAIIPVARAKRAEFVQFFRRL